MRFLLMASPSDTAVPMATTIAPFQKWRMLRLTNRESRCSWSAVLVGPFRMMLKT